MTIERAYASAGDTLDATSYTQINSMTLTPGAGNFLAVFNMQVQFNTSPGSETVKVAIYVDGVQQQHSIRTIQQNGSLNDMYWGVTTTAYVSPGASEVVEVRYIASAASAPMVGTNRELNLFPAPDTNYQDTDVVTDTIASATWTTVDTMTRTPAANDYLLVFSTTCESPAAGENVGFRLSVGGTPVAHTERQSFLESSANPATYVIMLMASISPNGSQVVEIEWSRISGTGTQSCYERNMILIDMPSGNIKQAQGTADDSDTTSGSDVAIDDMLLTDPGDNDWLVMFNSFDFYGSITSGQGLTIYKIYEGGAEDTNLTRTFEHEDSIDSAYMSFYLSGRQTLGLTTDDIQCYWNANSTVSRTIYERTLIAVREPPGDESTHYSEIEVVPVTYKLEGITKDNDGVALGSCECYLVKDGLDDTYTFIAYQLSNSSTGAYSFTGIVDNDAQYQVIAWKDDAPHVFDVTDHVLQPVVE